MSIWTGGVISTYHFGLRIMGVRILPVPSAQAEWPCINTGTSARSGRKTRTGRRCWPAACSWRCSSCWWARAPSGPCARTAAPSPPPFATDLSLSLGSVLSLQDGAAAAHPTVGRLNATRAVACWVDDANYDEAILTTEAAVKQDRRRVAVRALREPSCARADLIHDDDVVLVDFAVGRAPRGWSPCNSTRSRAAPRPRARVRSRG